MRRASSPLSRAPLERDDVVQRLVRRFKEAADVAGGLADALLVLDQRDAHVVVAVLAEADAGRHRHVDAFSTRSLENSRLPSSRNVSGIGTQANIEALRRREVPAGLGEAIDQRVAALAVGLAHLADAVVGPVQRRRGGDLDRA